MVHEYCSGGNLLEYLLRVKKPLSETVVRGMAKQLVSVLKYLKSCNVVHRDVKPENILLTGKFLEGGEIPELKVTDLGLCGFLENDETLSQPFGTIIYAAP